MGSRIKTIAMVKYVITQHVSIPDCGGFDRNQCPSGFIPELQQSCSIRAVLNCSDSSGELVLTLLSKVQ